MDTPNTRVRSVYVIGDSISMHYGPWLPAFLGDTFSYSRKAGAAAALENLDIPRGANGGDSERVRRYLETNDTHGEIPASDYLLLNCGLHDIKTDPASGTRQVELAAYRRNLEKIVEQGRVIAEELVWITTTPCDEAVHNARKSDFHRYRRDVIAYNRGAVEVMEEAGVEVIDLFAFTAALEAELGTGIYEDHVHFIPEVRRLQAAFIAGRLQGRAQSGRVSPAGR
jgi:hypothetical protein